MKPDHARRMHNQGGFTLVELLIALALSVLLMTALTSVVLTTWRANDVASSRVEASSQIRNFAAVAYDDFALSNIANLSGCVPAAPCTSPITLVGSQTSNSASPVVNPSYQVVYSYNADNEVINRQAGGGPASPAATNVTAFDWFVDTNSTVIVQLTVTVSSYSESQTFRFRPRVNP